MSVHTAYADPRRDLPFYGEEDRRLLALLPFRRFLAPSLRSLPEEALTRRTVASPGEGHRFLHEAAVAGFGGRLFASWYTCPVYELSGYTPIRESRSADGGKTWSEPRVIADDPSERILFCPPVYAEENGKFYLFLNQMVSPDHIHALDLYRLDPAEDRFVRLWSRPLPFKLNTNAVRLSSGRLILPGRCGELDGFPNTPAVLIAGPEGIEGEWRMRKMAPDGDLPDGSALVHPEMTAVELGGELIAFGRDDRRRVPLAYASSDGGETWGGVFAHDVPVVSSKVYAGLLPDGRRYLAANIDRFDRSRLALYLTDPDGTVFTSRLILFDREDPKPEFPGASACHYPAACVSGGALHIIATLGWPSGERGACLFTVDLAKL